MPFTGPIEDRIAVRELYGSYSGAGFAGDRAAWLDCWTDDPVWDTPAGKGEGVSALIAIWDGLWSGIEVTNERKNIPPTTMLATTPNCAYFATASAVCVMCVADTPRRPARR